MLALESNGDKITKLLLKYPIVLVDFHFPVLKSRDLGLANN